MLPLYISLIVGLLQSHANRYANLLGSINCLLYTIVYLYFGLYASAASALLVSCPMQFVTFILWNKKAWKQSTIFKKLTALQRIFISAGFIISVFLVMILLTVTNSNYRILDTLVALAGLASSILALLSYIEYTWIMLGTGVLNIVLYINMIPEYPEQVTYLIYGIYSLICIVEQFFTVRRLYVLQQKERQKQIF